LKLLFVQMCHTNIISNQFKFQHRLMLAVHLSPYC